MFKNDSLRFLAFSSSFVFSSAQALLLILFPLMADNWKLNLGSVIACFAWGTFLFLWSAPFWSKRSDEVGRAKILKVGLAGLFISFLVVAFLLRNPFESSTLNFIVLLLSRSVYGLFASGIAPVSQTIHAENSSLENSTQAMFSHSMSLSLGRVIGFAMLALFVNSLPIVLYIFALAMMFNLVFAYFTIDSNSSQKSEFESGMKFSFLKNLSPNVRGVLLIAFLVTSLTEALNSSFSTNIRHILHLTSEDAAQWASQILLFASLGIFVVQAMGRVFHQTLRKYGFHLGLIAFLAASLLFNVASDEKFIFIAITLFVLGLGIVPPIYLSHLKASSASKMKAVYAGLVGSAHTLGYVVGSTLTALVFTLGFETNGILLVILATALVAVGFSQKRNSSEKPFSKEAQIHTATCFLNSLFREWNGYQIILDSQFGKSIEVQISDQHRLLIPIVQASSLGRHVYQGSFYEVTGKKYQTIYFDKLVQILTDHLAQAMKTDAEALAQFKNRVFSSQENIRLSFEKKFLNAKLDSWPQSLNFKESEQSLLVGHNFHPTPKSRDQFSIEDLQKYSPEFGGQFKLDWYLVKPHLVHQSSAASFQEKNWTENLLKKDLGFQASAGLIAMPFHPWQIKVLQEQGLIRRWIDNQDMIFAGSSTENWFPTSSLRSIYHPKSDYMLKFSMTLKLTNSIRHLLPHEVERGLQLRDVISTQKGQEFLSAYPHFSILTEPAYLCLKDEAGNLLQDTIVVCRDNPFQKTDFENQVVLATLTQDALFKGKNLIQEGLEEQSSNQTSSEKAKQWFSQYLQVVVEPLVQAQANYGIILGAHQQNLILKIENGFPVAASFRDCQGTGYSELGFKNFAAEVPLINRQNGNVVSEKMGNSLFIYYLILNSTFNVISALAQNAWISEKILLADLHEFLIQLRHRGVQDPSCIDQILTSAKLPHKGNFLCAFQNMNENTTQDPLSIYVGVTNSIMEAKNV